MMHEGLEDGLTLHEADKDRLNLVIDEPNADARLRSGIPVKLFLVFLSDFLMCIFSG